MISVDNLSYTHGPDVTLRFPNWEVKEGGHGLILGASGSGKTTFLHLLGGLLKPTTGEVRLANTDLYALSSTRLDKFRGQHIGFIFQSPHLLKSLTVKQNVQAATFFGRKEEQNQHIDEVLSELDIIHLRGRKVHQISQGQAQRVAIARAVINRPNVIFADEPTASLDDQSCEAVLQLLKEQANRHQATLVIATHDQRIKSEFQNQLTL